MLGAWCSSFDAQWLHEIFNYDHDASVNSCAPNLYVFEAVQDFTLLSPSSVSFKYTNKTSLNI